MRRRAVITGLGVVSAIGTGKENFWKATLEGRSGVDLVNGFDTARSRSKVAAQVKDFDPCSFLPPDFVRRTDRFVHLGLAAAELAIKDSSLDLEKIDRGRSGVVLGSGLGGWSFYEGQIANAIRNSSRVHCLCVPKITPNAVSAHIGIHNGLRGPNFVVSSACASGNHGLGEALRKIQYGEADLILSGGAESPVTEFTYEAYAALRVLSTADRPPQQVSRPFDKDRDGFVLGEGAAILVIEELQHALKRDAHIYAELVGYGQTSGAYHMVIPEPEGSDAAATMLLALEDAGLRPRDIDYINAHGTSTLQNDVCFQGT